ncbi:uncharacterized protein DUF4265 [Chitinophaga skermanii]|uniref:Uncharacterized protein DUF4265 n=1 Tax=Chitinophaga skermanii TaxID=331697 RepID=A0A327QYD3_9BACT|nr:DUF4265 domain-containing protein [Chitinophaga skermanii]RAJ08433.1 uncharacterized protein DUF4265 [Chitinophaga skermanii]
MENNAQVEDVRIILESTNEDGELQREEVWAEKVGDEYTICNIPFLTNGMSYGDVVNAIEKDGEIIAQNVVKSSGNSTVHIMIKQVQLTKQIGEDFEALGCDWEASMHDGYISVHVPATTPYEPVIEYLLEGYQSKVWDFKESNLAHRVKGNYKKEDYQ